MSVYWVIIGSGNRYSLLWRQAIASTNGELWIGPQETNFGEVLIKIRLHWRHNGRDCVSNHQLHDCLLNRLFRHRSKKTSKLRVTGLCAGNSPASVNSPHKGPVTRKMFPFDDVIMNQNMSSAILSRPQCVKSWHQNVLISKCPYINRTKTNLYTDDVSLITPWHIEAETKLPPFRRRHFQMHFLKWKCINFA